jgi:3-methyladenine DNA glycosylase AlkD
VSASTPLLRAIRRELAAAADASKAVEMRAYMKSEMPYLGVQTPKRVAAAKRVYAEYPLASFASWRDTVLALWRKAKFREQRYAAIDLAQHRAYRDFRTLKALPLYEEIVVDGAWWDYVDSIATQSLFELLAVDRTGTKKAMRVWSKSDDLWKRRSAILFQLKARGDTDLKLLYTCIERAMDEDEFFLRKAIGWALREYAKTDAREVIRYVRRHRDRLSPLSKREALRICIKDGLLDAVP